MRGEAGEQRDTALHPAIPVFTERRGRHPQPDASPPARPSPTSEPLPVNIDITLVSTTDTAESGSRTPFPRHKGSLVHFTVAPSRFPLANSAHLSPALSFLSQGGQSTVDSRDGWVTALRKKLSDKPPTPPFKDVEEFGLIIWLERSRLQSNGGDGDIGTGTHLPQTTGACCSALTLLLAIKTLCRSFINFHTLQFGGTNE
ncbi:hypothetical protein AAFF_G00230170 [Aldrovandia affinis]|uniref:Uncharacterized protein n=1 Tax=Aldrovandia affinis TaxID=143900 RepID=A0AAD7WU59_9TELE|nr:hypothetical protein AAFF_G00230170 [Aldrovandia affinis]